MHKLSVEGTGCSINTIDRTMILSVPCEISDHGIKQMLAMVLERAHQKTIRGVILDFALVEVIDSFMYEKFLMMTQALYLMGIDVYWVKLMPPIVATLMDKDISLEKNNIKTATNIEKAIQLLK